MKTLSLLIVTLLFTTGCAEFRGYARLSIDEKEHYAAVADQMTSDQKHRFLDFETRKERDEYLALLHLLGSSTDSPAAFAEVSEPKSPKAIETVSAQTQAPAPVIQPQPVAPPVAPAAPVLKVDPPVVEAKPVAPVRVVPEVKPAVRPPVAVQQNTIPRVQYEKTGDPVTDVITLLKLLENGKITKEQFENEKELAFKGN